MANQQLRLDYSSLDDSPTVTRNSIGVPASRSCALNERDRRCRGVYAGLVLPTNMIGIGHQRVHLDRSISRDFAVRGIRMIESIFGWPSTRARHLSAPSVKERER